MTYRIMSFNLRCDTAFDGKHRWKARRPHVINEIHLQRPDVMGLQEVTHKMLEYLQVNLGDYDFVGKARDDGHQGGEYAAIFYRHDRFKLHRSGHFALSETPDVIGSWGWDAACKRIASWVILEDRTSKQQFFFLNTHADHQGVLAREASSLLIRQRAAEEAGALPIIICGDFNAAPEALSIRLMLAEPESFTTLAAGDPSRLEQLEATDLVLRDLRSVSEAGHLGPDFTFHNYRLPELLGHSERHRGEWLIDFIFANEKVYCRLHAYPTDMHEGLCISDHLPVIADVQLVDDLLV